MNALDVDVRVKLELGLSFLARALKEFSFGTACSGSEVLGYALECCCCHIQTEFVTEVARTVPSFEGFCIGVQWQRVLTSPGFGTVTK